MANMLEAMSTLGFIKTFVLDFPTALGHVEQRSNSHAGRWKIRQPVGFDHRAVRLALTIEEHPPERSPSAACSKDRSPPPPAVPRDLSVIAIRSHGVPHRPDRKGRYR